MPASKLAGGMFRALRYLSPEKNNPLRRVTFDVLHICGASIQ